MSEHEQEEQNCRDLEFLRPWIDAARADVSEAARRDVISHIESRGRKRGFFASGERRRAGANHVKPRRWRRRV